MTGDVGVESLPQSLLDFWGYWCCVYFEF